MIKEENNKYVIETFLESIKPHCTYIVALVGNFFFEVFKDFSVSMKF